MIQAAKIIGTGMATTGLIGAGVGPLILGLATLGLIGALIMHGFYYTKSVNNSSFFYVPNCHAFVNLPIQSRFFWYINSKLTRFTLVSLGVCFMLGLLYKGPIRFILTTLGLPYVYPLFAAMFTVLGAVIISNILTVNTSKMQLFIAGLLAFIFASFIVVVTGYHCMFIKYLLSLIELYLIPLMSIPYTGVYLPINQGNSSGGINLYMMQGTNATGSGSAGSGQGGTGNNIIYGPGAIDHNGNGVNTNMGKDGTIKAGDPSFVSDFLGHGPRPGGFMHVDNPGRFIRYLVGQSNQPLASNFADVLEKQKILGLKRVTSANATPAQRVFLQAIMDNNPQEFGSNIYITKKLIKALRDAA